MTNVYLWDRVTGRDSNIRASDADRERIAERLRKSHAEGRLDIAEFQERLERCYAAKTLGELGELVRDLPRQDVQVEPHRSGWLQSGGWRLAPLAPILLVLVLFSAAGGHHHFVWLWIPVLFLLWRTVWWRRRRSWAAPRRGWDEWI